MSYCVHCGVELADYEKECPLCNTPVCDPKRPAGGEPMFIDRIDLDEKPRLNRRFVTGLISIALLIPFAAVALIGVIFSLNLTWATFVLGAEICVWVWFVLPFEYKWKSFCYCIADTAAAALYLFLVALLIGNTEWYLPLALPLTLMAGTVLAVILGICQKKSVNRLAAVGWSILTVSLLPCGVDITVTRYLTGSFLPVWAWYVTIPLLVLGITVCIAASSVGFSEWLRKKLFI